MAADDGAPRSSGGCGVPGVPGVPGESAASVGMMGGVARVRSETRITVRGPDRAAYPEHDADPPCSDSDQEPSLCLKSVFTAGGSG